MIQRIILIILDSVGVGETPDAHHYGDCGANTLSNTAKHNGGLELPTLQTLGLGNLTPTEGVLPCNNPLGAFGKCAELSAGKDTTTGHWELVGLHTQTPFPVFPHGFPSDIIDPFIQQTGHGILGNKPASGTTILDELGEEHLKTKKLIVYTSGDSVFQIAAHEDVVPIDDLYRYCMIARRILDPYQVGRVIARPFIGSGKGHFKRTYNRRDFSILPPSDTVLNSIQNADLPVVGIGKIHDIYAGQGISTSYHTEGNIDGMNKTIEALDTIDQGLIMTNLVDFDMLYGHRRDPKGYGHCLETFDRQLADLKNKIHPTQDLVILTADHGNDPTMPGTDHTREYVPLIAFGPDAFSGINLGTRDSFADVGATIADIFKITLPKYGQSILPSIG